VELVAKGHSLSELGVPKAALAGTALEPEARLDAALGYERTAKDALRGHAELAFDRAPLGGGVAIPARFALTFDGDARGRVRVTSKAASVAQLDGTLDGELDVPTRRAKLAFDATAISCAAATHAFAEKTLGGLGAMLGGLTRALGGDAALAGSFSLHADVDVDLSAPEPVRIRTRKQGDCGLNLPF
jgi:hypothetical protein